MNIERWMTRAVVTVRARDTVENVRTVMADRRINQMPVIDGDAVIGIVTDRDVRDACPSVFESAASDSDGAASFDPAKVLVEDIMSANVLTLAPEDPVANAAELMLRERIGSVPVVSEGRLVGIIARSDILRAFTSIVSVDQTATDV